METKQLLWCVALGMALGAVSMLLPGCAERLAENIPPAQAVTWATLTTGNGVLASACQGCHPALHSPGLASTDYAGVVGVASAEKPALLLVKAGSKAESYLYLKMINDPSIAPTQMPPSGTLNSSLTDEVGAWIDAGAAP